MDDHDRGKSEWTAGAEIEFNPEGFLGGASIVPDLRQLYGPTRVSVLGVAAARWGNICAGRAEAQVSLKFIMDVPSSISPVATTLRGSCIFTEAGGWGLLTRFYHGQDYYNLEFLDNITRVSIGVTYAQDGFLRFKTR